MILPFRFSDVRMMIVLALGITTTACGGGYSTPRTGGQAKPLTNLSVYPQSSPSIPVGGTAKLFAIATYGGPAAEFTKEVTNSVTWTSPDEGVATVTTGQVTGTGVGSVAITAKLGSYSAATTVVVGLTPDITITSDGAGTFSLSQPQRQFFAAGTYSDSTVLDLTNFVKWSASPAGVMNFDDPDGLEPGLATFTSTGTATITATLKAGEEGNLTVTVDP
ncbi:MAG: hypothetical protein WBQ68_01945 [Terriglobales bacterium]